MSIEGQRHSFTIYFPGCVCFVLYLDKISGERLQDHWSSGFISKSLFRIDQILAKDLSNVLLIKKRRGMLTALKKIYGRIVGNVEMMHLQNYIYVNRT